MLSFLEYESSADLSVRLRNVLRQFWDFTALEWVAVENDNTRVYYDETANGDGMSLYACTVTVPLGGPYIQEAVDAAGEVVASDTTALDISVSAVAGEVEVSISAPTVVEIRQEMDANSTKLANLNATVSSRSTYAGGPVESVLGAVGSVTGAVGSVTAPVTVGTNQDKTGYSLSTAAILAIWNQATAAGGILVNTFGAKLRDWVLGTDNKALVSTDAQDLSTTLDVNAKTVEDKTGYALTAAYDAAKTAASQTSVNAIPTAPLLAADARLDHLDADISAIPTAPLLEANYTAPDNASVAAILAALQNATYGLLRLDTEIDAITTALSSLATNTDMQTVLTRLTIARAALLDNLQYLTAVPGLTTEQAGILTEARDEAKKARQFSSNKAVIANDGLSVTVYADDDVTPLWVFSIPDNKHRVPVR
jgi:hypothetical protein